VLTAISFFTEEERVNTCRVHRHALHMLLAHTQLMLQSVLSFSWVPRLQASWHGFQGFKRECIVVLVQCPSRLVCFQHVLAPVAL
jgi:hypothetical protein